MMINVIQQLKDCARNFFKEFQKTVIMPESAVNKNNNRCAPEAPKGGPVGKASLPSYVSVEVCCLSIIACNVVSYLRRRVTFPSVSQALCTCQG
eukprot:9351814-Karenia_brevis.AAC.1